MTQTNERYIGAYVAGKNAALEVGSHRIHRTKLQEWFQIPDHHEQLVTKELFEQDNRLLPCNSSEKRKPQEYPLRCKIFCGYSDYAMSRNKVGSLLCCRHSLISDSFACHRFQIQISELERTVLETVWAQIHPVTGMDNGQEHIKLHTIPQAQQEEKIRTIQARQRNIYEQYVFGKIDLAFYQEQKVHYDVQIIEEQNVYAAIGSQAKQKQQKCNNWKEYENILLK